MASSREFLDPTIRCPSRKVAVSAIVGRITIRSLSGDQVAAIGAECGARRAGLTAEFARASVAAAMALMTGDDPELDPLRRRKMRAKGGAHRGPDEAAARGVAAHGTPDAPGKRRAVGPTDRSREIGGDVDTFIAGLAGDLDGRGIVADAVVVELEKAVHGRRTEVRDVAKHRIEDLGKIGD